MAPKETQPENVRNPKLNRSEVLSISSSSRGVQQYPLRASEDDLCIQSDISVSPDKASSRLSCGTFSLGAKLPSSQRDAAQDFQTT